MGFNYSFSSLHSLEISTIVVLHPNILTPMLPEPLPGQKGHTAAHILYCDLCPLPLVGLTHALGTCKAKEVQQVKIYLFTSCPIFATINPPSQVSAPDSNCYSIVQLLYRRVQINYFAVLISHIACILDW